MTTSFEKRCRSLIIKLNTRSIVDLIVDITVTTLPALQRISSVGCLTTVTATDFGKK